jgi:hypothetical protein
LIEGATASLADSGPGGGAGPSGTGRSGRNEPGRRGGTGQDALSPSAGSGAAAGVCASASTAVRALPAGSALSARATVASAGRVPSAPERRSFAASAAEGPAAERSTGPLASYDLARGAERTAASASKHRPRTNTPCPPARTSRRLASPPSPVSPRGGCSAREARPRAPPRLHLQARPPPPGRRDAGGGRALCEVARQVLPGSGTGPRAPRCWPRTGPSRSRTLRLRSGATYTREKGWTHEAHSPARRQQYSYPHQ